MREACATDVKTSADVATPSPSCIRLTHRDHGERKRLILNVPSFPPGTSHRGAEVSLPICFRAAMGRNDRSIMVSTVPVSDRVMMSAGPQWVVTQTASLCYSPGQVPLKSYMMAFKVQPMSPRRHSTHAAKLYGFCRCSFSGIVMRFYSLQMWRRTCYVRG